MSIIKLLLGGFLLVGVAGACYWMTSSVEEPSFQETPSQRSQGKLTLREYDTTIVAEVVVTGSYEESSNRGFRILADYIFGNNLPQQKIAMTAPVELIPGEKIAMTAPVEQVQNDNAWVVTFTMPAEYTLETLPMPKDPRVKIVQRPKRTMAVMTFGGSPTEEEVRSKKEEFAALLAAEKLTPQTPVSLARYNPPWTPSFLKRNELMAQVASR